MTGQGVKNLSIVVYTMSKRVNPSINAVSTLVVVIITIVLLIVNIAPMIAAKKSARSELGRRKKFILRQRDALCLLSLYSRYTRAGQAARTAPLRSDSPYL